MRWSNTVVCDEFCHRALGVVLDLIIPTVFGRLANTTKQIIPYSICPNTCTYAIRQRWRSIQYSETGRLGAYSWEVLNKS